MKKDELERAILDLWLTTRIPLTQAHIQYHTGVSRKKLSTSLDELVLDGALGVDVTDDGEMVYDVPGAHRPKDAPRTFAELNKLGTLQREVQKKPKRIKRKKLDDESELGELQSELLIGQAKGLVKHAGKTLQKREEGDKSILLSSALSLFFGPLGWFYAGSYKEAAVGSLAYVALVSVLPSLLLMPLLGIAMPISGIAGLVYAWQHNKSGERKPLLTGKKDE